MVSPKKAALLWFAVFMLILSSGISHALPIQSQKYSTRVTLHTDQVNTYISFDIDLTSSLWTLVGNPVYYCGAKWKMTEVVIEGESIMSPHNNAFMRIPKKVLDDVYIYNFKVKLPAKSTDSAYICDVGSVFPSGSGKYSFNTPTSPSWNHFLIPRLAVLNNKNKNYLSEHEAKQHMKAIGISGLSNAMNFYQIYENTHQLVEGRDYSGRVNLWPIKAWMAKRHLADINKDFDSGEYIGVEAEAEDINDDFFDDLVETSSWQKPSHESAYYKKELSHREDLLSHAQSDVNRFKKRKKRIKHDLVQSTCMSEEVISRYARNKNPAKSMIKHMKECRSDVSNVYIYEDRSSRYLKYSLKNSRGSTLYKARGHLMKKHGKNGVYFIDEVFKRKGSGCGSKIYDRIYLDKQGRLTGKLDKDLEHRSLCLQRG